MAKKGKERVKTSIALPRTIWRKAHIRALDEGLQLQQLVVRALEAYLKGKRKGR